MARLFLFKKALKNTQRVGILGGNVIIFTIPRD